MISKFKHLKTLISACFLVGAAWGGASAAGDFNKAGTPISKSEAKLVAPGEYIPQIAGPRAIGYFDGLLTINDKQDFQLSVINYNSNMCDAAGVIVGHSAYLQSQETPDDPTSTCIVIFKQKKDVLLIASNGKPSCYEECGFNVGFEGMYFKRPAACTANHLAQTRKAFIKRFRQGAFEKALRTLEPVLSHCSASLHWRDVYWIRNDLALTHHKLGNDKECLRILNPLIEDASLDDDEIWSDLSMMARDPYLKILKATRTNLHLCKAAH